MTGQVFSGRRKRRVIYNDDADQQYIGSRRYGYDIVDNNSFIDSRTRPTFGTHVDTYVWCLGNGSEPPWAGSATLLPSIKSSGMASDLVVDACHSNDLEVWGSLRMNDIHDSLRANHLKDTDDPVKARHPDWLLGPLENRKLPEEFSEFYLWTAFNYALPEVRDYRLSFIERTASEHDFDGYELDFTRTIYNFPLGEGRQYSHFMTEFIVDTSAVLDSIGKHRGRPYTRVVHVTDSPSTSLDLGLDVEMWLDQGLVDVLVVGMGYTPYALRLDDWLDLAGSYGVPVYPTINTNTFGNAWTKLHGRPMYHEALRAVSSYYWQEGADGLYVFNLFDMRTGSDEHARPSYMYSEDADYIHAPLREIGDVRELVGRNKLYSIQPVEDRGRHQLGCEPAPLPVALDRNEHVLPLRVGPDVVDSLARISIRVLTSGGTEDTLLWIRVNNKLFKPIRNGDSWETNIQSGILRPGENALSIGCNESLSTTTNPVLVHRVFTSAIYT